jgi:hypothetical protein
MKTYQKQDSLTAIIEDYQDLDFTELKQSIALNNWRTTNGFQYYGRSESLQDANRGAKNYEIIYCLN